MVNSFIMSVIEKFNVFPDYAFGFSFSWMLDMAFNDSYPWVFQVEVAPAPDGEWKAISPQLVNIFCWSGNVPVKVNKSRVLFFRLKLKTPENEYYSEVIQPYGNLSKKEFLIAKDIMRREVLHMSQLAGVPEKVLLKANWGPRCKVCVDPITGRSRNSNCPSCVGTGFEKPYHGPYDMWMLFSSDSQHQMAENPNTGTTEQKNFTARAIGSIVLKYHDVVIDSRSNKRYYVNNAAIISEIRRIPIIQQLQLSEAAVTDPIYKLVI